MRRRKHLSRREICLVAGMFGYNLLIYNVGRLLGQSRRHFDFTTMLDQKIPAISWTVIIYLGCYLFWVLNYILGIRYGDKQGKVFMTAHYIGETVCFLLFLFLPTTMIRPEVGGENVADWILNFTYRIDRADNLFPSIHCFISWLCWIGVRNNPKVPEWYQRVSLGMAIAVCISTLTVKQHVIVDAIAGVLLAEISMFAAKQIK